MSEHTPEIDLTDEAIVFDFGHNSMDLCNSSMESLAKFNREQDGWEYPTRADAMAWGRRIVACVNALKGASTKDLEQAVQLGINDVSMGNLFSSRLKLTQEREEARAMVAELAKELDEISKFDKYDPAGPAALRAENALTKAQAFLAALHA